MAHVVEVLVLLFMAAAVAAGVVAFVAVRRRVRALRRRYVEWRDAGWAAAAVRQLELVWQRYPVTDPSWRRAYSARRHMHKALEGAGHAVAHADSAGAPVGDLASVVGRLRRAAGDVDRLLALHTGPARGPSDRALADAASVVAAADDIRHAATVSLHHFTSPDLEAATADAANETAALHAGLRSVTGPS